MPAASPSKASPRPSPAHGARRPRAGAPRRERLDARERSARLVQAFVREALRQGSIEGVGMRAVCERAGCTAPVAYRLFRDRAGLVRAAIRSTHERLEAELEAAAAEPAAGAEARLRAVAGPYLSRATGDAEVFEALVVAECRSDPLLAIEVRAIYGRFAELLARILREGVARGELGREVDPVYAAWRLIDLGLFRNQMRLLRLPEPERIDYLERAFESLLAELRGGARGPRTGGRRPRRGGADG